MDIDHDNGTVRVDWHGYAPDQAATWADRVVEAAYAHGFEYVEFVHGASDVVVRGTPGYEGAGVEGRGQIKALLRRRLFRGQWRRWVREMREGRHDISETKMLIALRENPKPDTKARWPVLPPARVLMSQPEIILPELPEGIEWINIRVLPMRALIGRTVPLVWFWDYCSLNALRALPYLQEWHRRYSENGLRVIGVHSPEFDFGKDRSLVESAVRKLGIDFPVAPDPDFEIWRLYGNEVWPALYLWDRRGVLRHFHFAEGDYERTERAIQELLHEIDAELELPEPMTPLRPTDHAEVLVKAPTPHRYLDDRSGREVGAGDELSVRYQGASAAAVLNGSGTVELEVDGRLERVIRLDGPRLYKLVESAGHEEHELTLRFRGPARAYAFSFAAGPM